MALDFTPKSVWNIDDDRLKILSLHLAFCDEAFAEWDLESLYIYLHSIKRIASPKLRKNKTDWDTLKKKFEELEKLRRTMYPTKSQDSKKKIEFYNKASDLYEELCSQMQIHGLFFREGLDPGRAALRR